MNPDTYDEWYTPPQLLDALGICFQTDPASPGQDVTPWTAAFHYTKKDDGLKQEWVGKVWLNPPYSDPMPWAERMVEHCSGIMLVRASTETKYFQMLAENADGMLLMAERVRFIRFESRGPANRAPFPSALFAFGRISAQALLAAAIPGVRGILHRGENER